MSNIGCAGLPGPPVQVRLSFYVAGPHMTRLPKKGPYFDRRLKRMARDRKNWHFKPEFFLLDREVVLVHPAYWPLVERQLIENQVAYVVV